MSEGLKLAAIYGYPPCRLGLCGRKIKNAPQILADFLIGRASAEEARNVLENFEASFRYYELIAQENGIKDVFEVQVVEAYWLGNDLLEKVSAQSLQSMILHKFKRTCDVQAHDKPTHFFHVYVLGAINTDLPKKAQDLCAVCIGQWQDLQDKIKNPFLGQIKKGDWVSYHWKQVCQVLDEEQLANFGKFNAQHK